MLIMKVDYKNIDTEVRDEFVKYMKRWHTTLNHIWIDYEAFPTFLTAIIRNSKNTKVFEDVVDSFVKRNNIDVLECINACPSGNNGIYKTIIFSKSEPESKIIGSFNKDTGDGYYTEDFMNEIVDRVVARINTKQKATYSDAVKAIGDDLSLWSTDKTAILSWLLPGLDSEVYQAIINITKSDMVPTCRRDAMIDIAKKASSIMGNE